MTAVLCFDIETVPDVAGMRRLLEAEAHGPAGEPSSGREGHESHEGHGGASSPDGVRAASSPDDAAVAELFFARRRDRVGHDFLPLHQHRVVAIACLMRTADDLIVRCLGQPEDDEARLIALFYKQIERFTPQIVSWNGGGFDLPVLNYRALVHGIAAPRFWDTGDTDREFRYNNYLSRYHSRHLDLMDVFAMYSPRASVPLDELARLCGFPGKLGMNGGQVWAAWQGGGEVDIRRYCETDVANTWLMYCRFQLVRGHWDRLRYDAELERLRHTVTSDGGPHWQRFLAAWETQ